MSELSIIHDLDVNSAPLPIAYEKAKTAISECVNIDECKDWSDKAQALASYARQSGDDELEKMSKRIRVRAMRRCGELLKMFDGRGGDRKSENIKRVSADPFDKSDMGKQAGLSVRQIKQANNLSNIPDEKFNEQIEGNNMPTMTDLANQGKKKLDYLYQKKPPGFAEGIYFEGALDELMFCIKDHDPEFILGGIDESTKHEILRKIASIELWFDQFVIKS